MAKADKLNMGDVIRTAMVRDQGCTETNQPDGSVIFRRGDGEFIMEPDGEDFSEVTLGFRYRGTEIERLKVKTLKGFLLAVRKVGAKLKLLLNPNT